MAVRLSGFFTPMSDVLNFALHLPRTNTKDMSAKTHYEVGDTVFESGRMGHLRKLSVVKVGKIHAVLSNGTKIRVGGVNGASAAGSGAWSTAHYYLTTPELESRYERQMLIASVKKAIESVSVKSLSNDQLVKLTEAIKTITA